MVFEEIYPLFKQQILMGRSQAYLQPGKRNIEEKGNEELQKKHKKENDESEASSTVLGYSLLVSLGPCCRRTILFLFFFFFFFNILVPSRNISSYLIIFLFLPLSSFSIIRVSSVSTLFLCDDYANIRMHFDFFRNALIASLYLRPMNLVHI